MPSFGKKVRLPKLAKNVESEWELICISAFLFAVILILVGAGLFWSINEGKLFAPTNNTAPVVEAPSPSLIHSAIVQFDTRREAFESVRTGREAVADPSR